MPDMDERMSFILWSCLMYIHRAQQLVNEKRISYYACYRCL